MTEEATKAVEVLKAGGIVIFPTDTAFGIGCRIDNPAAVDRLFAIRKRPTTQAMPVLVSSIDQALAYLDSPSDIVRRLMKTYWPGQLTIVSTCKKNLVYSPILGGGQTIGLRMPNYDELRQIIERVGVPVLGPSANIHGEKTPFYESELDPELVRQVDFVLSGVCMVREVSTVVDVSSGKPVVIRKGAVDLTRDTELFIDTSEIRKTTIRLQTPDGTHEETVFFAKPSSEITLPLIETILAKHKKTLENIIRIHVFPGPGSYTGLRVGMAIGRMLGLLLTVPVNGKPATDIPEILYDTNDPWHVS